jgi:hypothetical protein
LRGKGYFERAQKKPFPIFPQASRCHFADRRGGSGHDIVFSRRYPDAGSSFAVQVQVTGGRAGDSGHDRLRQRNIISPI